MRTSQWLHLRRRQIFWEETLSMLIEAAQVDGFAAWRLDTLMDLAMRDDGPTP